MHVLILRAWNSASLTSLSPELKINLSIEVFSSKSSSMRIFLADLSVAIGRHWSTFSSCLNWYYRRSSHYEQSLSFSILSIMFSLRWMISLHQFSIFLYLNVKIGLSHRRWAATKPMPDGSWFCLAQVLGLDELGRQSCHSKSNS